MNIKGMTQVKQGWKPYSNDDKEPIAQKEIGKENSQK